MPGVHKNQGERRLANAAGREGRGFPPWRSLWEGAKANVTGGAGAGPEHELEAQKRGLNPDGQQREAVGNGEKPALWLTSGVGVVASTYSCVKQIYL